MKTAFDFSRKDRRKGFYVGYLKDKGVKSLEIKIVDHKKKASHTKVHQFYQDKN